MIIANFVNPIINIISFILILFKNKFLTDKNKRKGMDYTNILSVIYSIIVLSWASIIIFYLYKIRSPLTLWDVPSDINIYVFPISIISICFLIYYSVYPIFQCIPKLDLKKPYHLINIIADYIIFFLSIK